MRRARSGTPLLGAIADDLTGATDLAGSLARIGMRVAIRVGVPDDRPGDHVAGDEVDSAGPDCLIVALKSRSIPALDAVDVALRALRWLQAAGAPRIYFKYASTFDSTPAGNIGPVTEALQDALGASITVACPAFPTNGRTVVGGRLLVDGVPLADSPMRHHPLNPMTESDLVRMLGAQTRGPVDLVPGAVVSEGSAAVRAEVARLATAGVRHAIVDAASDADLAVIAGAVVDEVLVTGGSALAAAIVGALHRGGAFTDGVVPVPRNDTSITPTQAADLPSAVVLAGSCSAATLRQLAAVADRWPTLTLDPLTAIRPDEVAAHAAEWARSHHGDAPLVIRSSADPATLARVIATVGPDAGRRVEIAFGAIARRLVQDGVRRLVVAGGETSGAVVDALGLDWLDVVDEIEPGVPWVRSRLPGHEDARAGTAIHLVLKSGNFGSDAFLPRAIAAMT